MILLRMANNEISSAGYMIMYLVEQLPMLKHSFDLFQMCQGLIRSFPAKTMRSFRTHDWLMAGA